MSDSYVGSTATLDDHAVAVQRFGGGPPDPGWYAYTGFRTGAQVMLQIGPCVDLAALRIAYRWHQLTRLTAPYVPITQVLGFAEFERSQLAWTMGDLERDIRLFNPIVITGNRDLWWVGKNLRIDSFVKLEIGQGLLMGHDVHIASMVHLGIGGGCTILEDGTSFGSGAKVISGSNISGLGHGCSAIAPDAVIRRSFAHIKKNATLYAGATVLPGVTVGENAVLAAGAVATKDIPACEVWGGIPARFIRPV